MVFSHNLIGFLLLILNKNLKGVRQFLFPCLGVREQKKGWEPLD